jgi:hypothetical protein
LFSSGSDAIHIRSSSTTPAPAAMRMPMPSASARPMPSRPSMNSQSKKALPAMELKNPAKVPSMLPR